MKLLTYPFWILYRVWFYVLVTVPIVVLFPLLIVVIAKESWYLYFFKLARFWAKFILIGMGLPWKIIDKKPLENKKSYVFIANHTSMIDIMLMLVCVKNNPFVFVGKQELAKIPLFGFFYRRTCILVDRNSAKSRQTVFLRAQNRLESGLSICIFPEGGVPGENVLLDEFKNGAFRLAINHKIPVVPFSFLDNKKRFSYTLFSGGPGLIRAKMHNLIDTQDIDSKQTKNIKAKAYNVIRHTLLKTVKA